MAIAEYDFKKVALFVIIVIFIIAGLAGAGSGVYYYVKYKKSLTQLQNTNLVSREQVQQLVAKVGKLIKLPENEEPTVATITNLESVKDKPFFAKAKIGDKLLIYNQAKKVFLYDPIENKIVEVGPLIIPSGSPAPLIDAGTNVLNSATVSTQLQTTPEPTAVLPIVAILNSTNNKNLSTIVLNELRTSIKNTRIIDSGPESQPYDNTIVFDITGKYKQITNQVAQILNASVASPPEDQQIPQDADILVIVGLDRLPQPTQ